MSGGLRRAALGAAVAFWGVLFLVSLVQGDGWTGYLSRLAAAGGLGLALAGARDGWSSDWGTWGTGTLAVSSTAAILWGVWSGSAWAIVGVLAPAAAVLAAGSYEPVLPADGFRLAAILLAAYLALAPAVDGLLVDPAEPASAHVVEGPYEAGETRTFEIGQEGQLGLSPARAGELPRVDLLTGVFRADTDVPAVLASTFEANGSGYFIPTPTPFLFAIERHKDMDVRDLEGDWTAVSLSVEEGASAFLVLRDMEGKRQVFVYERFPAEDRLQLVPPFRTEWDAIAGYRFAESGDNPAALRALDGNVTVDGRTLQPPVEAVEELEVVGEYETPMGGPLAAGALLAAVGLARLGRRT